MAPPLQICGLRGWGPPALRGMDAHGADECSSIGTPAGGGGGGGWGRRKVGGSAGARSGAVHRATGAGPRGGGGSLMNRAVAVSAS